MPARFYKPMLTTVALLLILAMAFVQRDLVREREELGLTRFTELKGAPPILALTTVVLGGFRGLISNALWIRASDLQDQDKFFEMVQLADWITKLEPHFTQVWLVQAWNMAYNISVKFQDPLDRWRWVERGIELLRDEGLHYNPHDVLIHRELGWFFQHKMGQNLDDAHRTYKQMWANEMSKVFGMDRPKWDELLNPQTDDARQRVQLLREKYKMDPVFMKQVDDRYGPLEWRLPEASAIYWAAQGLEDAKYNQRQIDPKDLITLRRVIYQSMQMCFERGRLVPNKVEAKFEMGPDLAMIPKVSSAYEQAMEDDAPNRDHIETAHRNFVRNAVFMLYTYNREADALKWFQYLCKKYPKKPLLDGKPDSLPGTLNLDDYAIGRIQDEVNDAGHDKAEGILEGLEARAFESLAVDEDDHYAGMDHLAQKIWDAYEAKSARSAATKERVGLRPLPEIKKLVLDRLLNGEMSPQLAAQLRTKLGMPAAPAATPGGTNSIGTLPSNPVPSGSTNAPAGTNATPSPAPLK